MKIQNLAIIFIVIILPILFMLGYYLNLQAETLELQADYDKKLASSVKEGIKAYEINTVNWREVQGEERRNVSASMNTFISSLANNLGVAGTSKEYMINYIPAVIMTMYDGYYIYSPGYVPKTIENEQGVQLYYDGTIVTTESAATGGKLNDVIYEPSSSATSRKNAWYYYTDEAGKEQKKSYTFVTDATQAEREYKHTLSNKIAYSGTYTAKSGTIDVTINYTLDNRIYIYGKDNAQNKDINEQGCLVYFNSSNCTIPRITLKTNPQREEDIVVNTNSRIDKLIYNGSNINAEILTEQIVYKENASTQESVGTFKYIYDIEGTKLYYDDTQGSFFTISTTTKEKQYLSEDIDVKVGDEEGRCKYKSVSILTSDSTYKKLYQVLNGRDKGKWYISLKEDSDRITEIGPGIEVIDTEIKENVLSYGFSAIYMDYSAISYYVEAYAFTNWIRDRLGETVSQSKIVFNEDTGLYEQKNVTLNHIFNIGYVDSESGIINDLEKEYSLISEHKKQVMMDTINSNLNVSISNYAQNTAGLYKMPVFKYEDWDQIFKNISMIAFFQGVPIGLKTYNNYAIATSSLNRDYVDPDGLYFVSKSTSFHRPYCTRLALSEIEDKYIGYRSVEYTLKSYAREDGEIYYYQHTEQPTTTDTSDLGCYYCIVNKANYAKTIDIISPTAEQIKIADIQAKAYKEALARERYYQDVEIAEDLGIKIKYHENIRPEIQATGIITSVTNMPEDQEAYPDVYTQISDKIPIATTNDRYIRLRCLGWSLDPSSTVANYLQGQSYIFTKSEDLYAIWTLDFGNLVWIRDYYWTYRNIPVSEMNNNEYIGDGSVSYIYIDQSDEYSTDIHMLGNGNLRGKGATWTTVNSPIIAFSSIVFDYNVNFGHSFNMAGVLFNINDSRINSANVNKPTGQLEAYLVSFNNSSAGGTNIFKSTRSNASLWKITYDTGQYTSYISNTPTKCEHITNLNINKTGTMEIVITDTGYNIMCDGALKYTLTVTGSNKYPNSIGFITDHFGSQDGHSCGNHGHFAISDIRVNIKFTI